MSLQTEKNCTEPQENKGELTSKKTKELDGLSDSDVIILAENAKKNKNMIDYKMYLNIAIDKGNINAIYNMAIYYKNIGAIDEMVKYYTMYAEKGCTITMNKLGFYYQNTKFDFEKMKKYYLMAIDNDCIFAMYNLGNYYQYTKKDFKAMEKYYMMAIKHNDYNSMYQLAIYYDEQQNYEKSEQYYLKSAENYNIQNYTIININIVYNKLYQIYYKQDRLDEAKIYYEKCDSLEKEKIKFIKPGTKLTELAKLKAYIVTGRIFPNCDLITIYINKMNKFKKIDECNICMDKNVDIIPLNCTHYFCSINCYYKCIKDGKCPICRVKICYMENST